MTTVAGVASRWLISALAMLMFSTLPLIGASAAEARTAPDAEAELAEGDGSATASGGAEVVRYSAADRYELSLGVAAALAQVSDSDAGWVVLASGEDWVEAAVAGPLAASLGAPMVLVPPGGLQTPLARPGLVEFLRSVGTRRAMIVASAELLPNHEPSVLFDAGMLPRNVERVHGADRAGTALAAAQRMDAQAELGGRGRTVVVVSDQSLADAVAVGPLAAAGPFPLLLTPPDALDPRVTTFLSEQEVEHVVLVGGTGAVSSTVHEAIESAGLAVTRLAGQDRIGTSKLASELFERHVAASARCVDGPTRIALAPDIHPEQALTAGPLLAALCAPLRYTEPDRLPIDLHNALYLAGRQPQGVRLSVFGDRSMMPEATADVSFPPTRVAFVRATSESAGGGIHVEIGVVDERGTIEYFPQTASRIASWSSRSPPDFCWIHDLAWSASGRFLSYRKDCEYDIHVLDTYSGDSYRIAHDIYELSVGGLTVEDEPWGLWRAGPRWSPVDDRLAFTASTDDPATEDIAWGGFPVHYSELFVHDATTRSTRRLTHNSRHDLVGTWSPDGRTIASSVHSEAVATDPYYRVAIYSGLLDAETGEFGASGFGPTWANTVEWSPDGIYIAFQGGDGWWTDQVVMMKSDGSDFRWLTPVGCEDCYDEGGKHPGAHILGWSPSGARLAFSDSNYVAVEGESDFSNEETVHYVFDVTTGETTPVLDYTTVDWESPSVFFGEWSLDGESLFYARLGETSAHARTLLRVSVADGAQTPVAELPILWTEEREPVHASPQLSPDQRQLLLEYTGGWFEGIPGFWLADIGASDPQRLVDFESLVNRTEDGRLFPVSESFPERSDYRTWHWGCSADWSAIGIVGICEYR